MIVSARIKEFMADGDALKRVVVLVEHTDGTVESVSLGAPAAEKAAAGGNAEKGANAGGKKKKTGAD